MRDYTPKIEKRYLEHGAYYAGRCRNAEIARWNGKTEQFYHWRYKFGSFFIETIKHPEDEDRYDVFVVDHKIGDDEVDKVIEHRDFND